MPPLIDGNLQVVLERTRWYSDTPAQSFSLTKCVEGCVAPRLGDTAHDAILDTHGCGRYNWGHKEEAAPGMQTIWSDCYPVLH